KGVFAHVEGTVKRDAHDVVEVLSGDRRDLFETGSLLVERVRGSGVVDQRGEGTEGFDGRVDHSFDFVLVRDVGGDEDCFSAARSDVFAHAGAALARAPGHDDLGALAGKHSGGRCADATCRSGDNGNLV